MIEKLQNKVNQFSDFNEIEKVFHSDYRNAIQDAFEERLVRKNPKEFYAKLARLTKFKQKNGFYDWNSRVLKDFRDNQIIEENQNVRLNISQWIQDHFCSDLYQNPNINVEGLVEFSKEDVRQVLEG